MEDEWIFVRIRRRIADTVVWLLRGASIEPHDEARHEKDPKRHAELRQRGDDLHEAGEAIETAARRNPGGHEL